MSGKEEDSLSDRVNTQILPSSMDAIADPNGNQLKQRQSPMAYGPGASAGVS